MNCPVPINNHTAYASLFSYKVSLVTPSDLDRSPIFSMRTAQPHRLSVFVVELLPVIPARGINCKSQWTKTRGCKMDVY